jgi:hypothetical protein
MLKLRLFMEKFPLCEGFLQTYNQTSCLALAYYAISSFPLSQCSSSILINNEVSEHQCSSAVILFEIRFYVKMNPSELFPSLLAGISLQLNRKPIDKLNSSSQLGQTVFLIVPFRVRAYRFAFFNPIKFTFKLID